MTVYEALAEVPDLILVHVGTFEVAGEEVHEQRKQFWCNIEETDREKQANELEAEPGRLGCHKPPPTIKKTTATKQAQSKKNCDESADSESD